MSLARSPYEILEINANASQDDIKKAFRKLALQWHPQHLTNKNTRSIYNGRLGHITNRYKEYYDRYLNPNPSSFGILKAIVYTVWGGNAKKQTAEQSQQNKKPVPAITYMKPKGPFE